MVLAFKLPLAYLYPFSSPQGTQHSTHSRPLRLHNCNYAYNPKNYFSSLPLSPIPTYARSRGARKLDSFGVSYRYSSSEEDSEDDENCSFDEAVSLFNQREYYKCHDFLEALWNKAEEPTRTLIHGILQCAVGFHHLFNQVETKLTLTCRLHLLISEC